MVQAVHLDDSQKLTEIVKSKKSSFKAAKTGFEGREAGKAKAPVASSSALPWSGLAICGYVEGCCRQAQGERNACHSLQC